MFQPAEILNLLKIDVFITDNIKLFCLYSWFRASWLYIN